ncbi:Uncharacterised protein [uncultured archaeon]|nr:Uncharacterised protein [uncultured archaeon]
MNEVILQTVRRMIESGVDDATIRDTLRGINLSDSDIDSILLEAKKVSDSQQQAAEEAADDAAEGRDVDNGNSGSHAGAEGTGEDSYDAGGAESELGGDGPEEEGDLQDSGIDELKGHIEDTSQENLAHHSETHQMLNEHSERIGALHESISALHDKIDSSQRLLPPEAIACLTTLDRRLSTLEEAVSEAKANTIALQSLMQKVLETDRATLLELQKKNKN